MKNTLKTVIVMAMITIVGLSAQAQSSVPDAVVNATRKNDSRALAVYFNDKVELIIPGKSGVFSNAQAEQVIKSFFAPTRHPTLRLYTKACVTIRRLPLVCTHQRATTHSGCTIW
jgi:hypothetical protein